MPVVKSDVIFTGMALVARSFERWMRQGNLPQQLFEAHQFEYFVDSLNAMSSVLGEANLPMSAKHARGLVEGLNLTSLGPNGLRIAEGLSKSKMEHHMDKLLSILPDEAETKIFLSLNAVAAHLYEPSLSPFGNDVDRVFPVAIDDVRSAGKCLALSMGTATVFHLMRVMEAGLKAVAVELGVDYAPSWEAYERKLTPILASSNYNNLSPEQRAKRPFYDAVLSDLMNIKMVWRNPTMHIVKSYDASEAGLIYASVEIFMRRLASALPPIDMDLISTGPTR